MSLIFLFHNEQTRSEYKILCPGGYLELNFQLLPCMSLWILLDTKSSTLEVRSLRRELEEQTPALQPTSSPSEVPSRGHWLTSSKGWRASLISPAFYFWRSHKGKSESAAWTPIRVPEDSSSSDCISSQWLMIEDIAIRGYRTVHLCFLFLPIAGWEQPSVPHIWLDTAALKWKWPSHICRLLFVFGIFSTK